eukprot:Gb_13869 [translate_table: standard]
MPATNAEYKLSVAKNLLDSWSEVYLQVRERIELGGRDPRVLFDIQTTTIKKLSLELKKQPQRDSNKKDMGGEVEEPMLYWSTGWLLKLHKVWHEAAGRGAFLYRWEFDRKKLFERTSYMSNICVDLLHIVEVVDDFHNFLGPELKAVTGDAQGIDSVIQQVTAMVEPVEKLPFEAFDKFYAAQWSSTMSNFNVEKENIERLTKAFIDTSFKKLRSAEGALELLKNFKSIKSEGAINKQMMDKFNDIFAQVIKKTYSSIGSLCGVRGAITLKTMLLGMLEENNDQEGEELAYKIATFRFNVHFKGWPPYRPVVLLVFLKEIDITRGIFDQNSLKPPMARNQPPVAGSINWARCLFGRLRKTMQKFETIGSDVMQDPAAQEPILARDAGGEIVANFHRSIHEIIRETKYLDAMGFQLPETALNVTLQEEKYNSLVASIQNMLQHYHTVLRMLTTVESQLLSSRFQKLQHVLDPGFLHLNWNSLGTSDFVSSCMKAINEFKSLVIQVQNNSSSIEKAVEAISKVKLVQLGPYGKEPDCMEFQARKIIEFHERLEEGRQKAVTEALKQNQVEGGIEGERFVDDVDVETSILSVDAKIGVIVSINEGCEVIATLDPMSPANLGFVVVPPAITVIPSPMSITNCFVISIVLLLTRLADLFERRST